MVGREGERKEEESRVWERGKYLGGGGELLGSNVKRKQILLSSLLKQKVYLFGWLQ